MIKNLLLAAALLSLSLAVGCAKGGNGSGSGITVTVGDNSISHIYPTQKITFTATVTGTTNTTVTWSLSGPGCTGSGNPCGTIDMNSGAYVAPGAPPNPATVTITATSAADSTAKGDTVVTIQLIGVIVTPTAVTVGTGLEQQFTAIATPDDAPQTFTWSLTCTTSPCGQLTPGANNAGLALYTAGTNQIVQVSATSTVPVGYVASDTVKATVVPSRLLPSSTYGFQFSGYDTSNPPKPVAAIGTVTTNSSGAIATGVEDVLTSSGETSIIVDSGLYVPSSPNSNSNNLGTLTLNLHNGVINTYAAVLTSSGSIQMIETDAFGKGSGIMQKAAPIQFNSGGQTFAFGFTGTDASSNRVGYVGMLTTDGNGNITSGLLDSNDNGSTTTVCSTPPCSLLSGGTYQHDPTFVNLWHVKLFLTSASTARFDFVLGGGTAQTKTGPNPLTLFAISTDPVDATHPALSGSMVYQVQGTPYNNAFFNGSAVSTLTGTNANVALVNGTTDGKSGGTGGAGGFIGNSDQNNNGTLTSVASFNYTYVASSSSNGRYTIQMLGNPNANPVVAPITCVLYASGADRGFLLEQPSSTDPGTAVMAGAMYPAKANGPSAPSELPGTYAVATASNSSPSIDPFVQNLLLTSPGNSVFNVTGVQNPHNVTLTGTYTIMFSGTGSITLTAPAATNVIYAVDFDNANSVITDFFMMGTSTATPSAISFAQQ